MQQQYFTASNLDSSGHSHVGLLLTNEEQKKSLVCEVIYFPAKQAGLVHDVTNTDCQMQKGSTHSHVLQLSNFKE